MITLQKFSSTIVVIEKQMLTDKRNSSFIEKVFPHSIINVYDNSELIKSIIGLLQEWFPRDENGFCNIEHYCYDLNFGKLNGEDVLSIENLYFKLTTAT